MERVRPTSAEPSNVPSWAQGGMQGEGLLREASPTLDSSSRPSAPKLPSPPWSSPKFHHTEYPTIRLFTI